MRKKVRSAYLLESLEARLLFSADLAPLPVDVGTSGAEFESGLEISLQPDSAGVQEAKENSQERHEVIFVDTGVDDYQQLIDDIESQLEKGRQFDIVNLDSDSNGIDQISAYLRQHEGIDAVHVVSHGSEDAVKLGNVWLTPDKLDAYADAIEGWQQALSTDADLLFYGCNLAAGDGDHGLVNSLTLLTGADVAASDDVTGNAKLGGDWDLEYSKGTIETAVAFSPEAQHNWNGVLATFAVNTTADTVDANPGDGIAEDAAGNTSLRAAIMEANALAGADSITLSAGTYSISIAGTGDDVTLTGDLDITSDLTITGMGAGVTVIDGGGLDRVFHIDWSGNATITNLTVQNGGNVPHGGGIRVSGGGGGGRLNLENVIVRNNTATVNGGGIFVDGVVTLTNVEISGNTTSGTGGGLSNDEQATLTGVTISGNSAADGGGIYNSNQGNLLELTNVTVSGNTATVNGGGIYTAALVKLTNVTLTSNLGGGGIYATGGQGDVQLKNSILANNTGGNSNLPLTSLGYNIEDGNSAFTPTTGDQPNTDPSLGPLQNNGGFTQTHALLAGSPAIDPVGLSGAPLHDQRGYARDVTPDIGAFEYNVSNTAPTITSVTGAPMVGEDAVYSLDLTFTDPDDSTVTWTVNWGDGQISSAPSTGATTTLTHTYTQPGFTYNILVSANDGDVTVLQNELLVPSYAAGDSIFRYEETTGAFLQEFATANGLDDPIQAIIGPDGNLYVTSEKSDQVLRYNAVNGAFIDEFVSAGSGGLNEPGGLAFGLDGNLYVSSFATDEVLRYDGTSGAFIDAFVTAGSGGLNGPYGLTFGSDGNLYINSYLDSQVLRYNGTTGAFIDVFVSSGSGGLSTPEQMIFGPDGNLYIASFDSNNVLRYNGTTGAFIDTFVAAGVGGLDHPSGLSFGPDGNLYVADHQDAVILRYNGTTGAFIDEYVSAGSGGLVKPVFISFLPEQQVLVNPVNDAPTLSGGPYNLGSTDEDNASTGVQVTTILGGLTSSDADGDTLGIAVVTASGNGTWQYSTNSTDGTDGTWTAFGSVDSSNALLLSNTSWVRYVPDGLNGENVNIDFHAWDGSTGSASVTGTPSNADPAGGGGATAYSNGTAIANLTVIDLNDAPTITSVANTAATEDSPYSYTFTVNDVDVGDTLTLSAPTLPAWLTFNTSTGVLSGTPTNAEVGDHAVVLRVNDGTVDVDQSFTITVTNTNDAGTVTIDNTTPAQGDTLTANVVDPDGISGAITYQWFSDGAVIGGATGKTYTTTQSDVGAVMTVTAIYTDDLSTAEILTSLPTAPVTNVNDAPIAGNDNLNAIEDQSMIFTFVTDLLGNDLDIDGDTLTLSGFAQPDNGMLVNNGDGTFTYTPDSNFNDIDSFTYTISDNKGGTATGAAIIVVTPVGDTPQVSNVSTNAEVQSGLINIDRNANDGAEVTHFKISGITNGTLYLADGVTRIDNNDFINVGQGQAGLRFTPAANSTADGSFNVESSEDGVSVASQSGIATSIISILTTAPQPSEPVPSLPPSGPEEVVSEETELEEIEELEDVVDETDAQAVAEDMASVETPQNVKAPGIKKASWIPSISILNRADLNSNNDRTPGRSTLLSPQTLKKLVESENLGELKTALRKLDITTLPPDVYQLVRGSLDAVQEEMGNEILIGKTVVGSAIATSVGLSAGYVVWMLKGGSLLASVLSSLPAWQLADPLAILVGTKEDEDEDDDTLETIIEDGSRRNEDKERNAYESDKHKKESIKR